MFIKRYYAINLHIRSFGSYQLEPIQTPAKFDVILQQKGALR